MVDQPNDNVEQTPEYDAAAWEKLKGGVAFAALEGGRKIGVPQHFLDELARMEVAKVRAIDAERAKRFIANVERLNLVSAACIAELKDELPALDILSAQQPEMHAARAAVRQRLEEAQRAIQNDMSPEEAARQEISLSLDATVGDLFDAIDALGLTFSDFFMEELRDNFGGSPESDAAVNELIWCEHSIRDQPLIAYFEQRIGMGKKEMIAYLPIRFRKK